MNQQQLNDTLPRLQQSPSLHSNDCDVAVTGAAAAATAENDARKWGRRGVLLLYFLTSMFLWADLSLMAPNLSQIAEEYGFDDTERDVKLGGVIPLLFFTVGVPVALLVGWLADFIHWRSPLYAMTCLLGELCCLATFFWSQTYLQLVITRTLTGISVGGSLPIIFSVLGDWYPSHQRTAVAATITTATGMGIGLGQGLAGFTGPKFGWRFPFLIVSIPGIICALPLFFVKDPPRGGKELAKLEYDEEKQIGEGGETDEVKGGKHESEGNITIKEAVEEADLESTQTGSGEEDILTSQPNEPHQQEDSVFYSSTMEDPIEEAIIMENRNEKKVSWKTTKEIFYTKTVALVFLQAAPSALPFGFCSTFLNDYLAQERGMSVEQATAVLMTFGIGNAIGVVLLSGVLGHYGYQKDVRFPPLLMGLCLLLSCIPMYFLVNGTGTENANNASILSLLSLVGGALAAAPAALERAILANVTVPESRGRANSILTIIDDLGKGLGPAIVSLVIYSLDSRLAAFNISLFGWILGGSLSLWIVCFVKRDEELTQERVRQIILVQEQEEEVTAAE